MIDTARQKETDPPLKEKIRKRHKLRPKPKRPKAKPGAALVAARAWVEALLARGEQTAGTTA